MKETTISGDDVGAQEVVTNETVLAGQPAEAATEGETGNSGGRDCPADRRQPKGLRLVIELGPEDASFSPRRPRDGIDPDPFHEGEIEHQPTVTDGITRHVVSPTADGEDELVLAGEGDRGNDIRNTGRAHDQRRVAVDHRIPEPTDGVVVRVARLEESTAQLRAKSLEHLLVKGWSVTSDG
jgi:hypothetical protein